MDRETLRKIFDSLFKRKKRRMKLLTNWLGIIPGVLQKSLKHTVVDVFEFLIKTIVVEQVEFNVLQNGIQLTENFIITNNKLTKKEIDVFSEIRKDRKAYFNTKREFIYNSLVLTQEHRELLMRDFVNLCFYHYTTYPQRKRWPLYALLAVQRLIFVQGHYIPALMDAEHAFQGLRMPNQMPIYTNRRCPI